MLSSGLFCPYILNNTSRSVYPKPNDYFFSKKFRFIEQQEKGQIVFELFAQGFQRLRDVILNGLQMLDAYLEQCQVDYGLLEKMIAKLKADNILLRRKNLKRYATSTLS